MFNFCQYSIPFKICLVLILFIHAESRKRLSQLEGLFAPNLLDFLKQKGQQQRASDELTKPEYDGATGNQREEICQEGWLNFQNRLCFVGIKEPQLPFFFGNTQCATFGANYTSVHSLDEFHFIVANFDLHQLWIGVVYGSDQFQDGTAVEPEVMKQIAPLVPWTDPSTPKGFICKAFANNYRKVDINFVN